MVNKNDFYYLKLAIEIDSSMEQQQLIDRWIRDDESPCCKRPRAGIHEEKQCFASKIIVIKPKNIRNDEISMFHGLWSGQRSVVC